MSPELAACLGAAAGAAAGWGARELSERLRRRKLGRLISFAAHELNSPLTAATMTASNLSAGVFGSSPEAQKPWLDLMREQLSRLSALTGELRDLAHLELTGAFLHQEETLEAQDVVGSAVRAVAAGCAQGKIELISSVEPGAGAVRSDPDRLPRILASLLVHGRKFRTTGPVRVTAKGEHASVAFEVEYETEDLQPAAALDVYYPASAQKQQLKASGLGLGLLRITLERMGASLTLSSDGKRQRLTLRAPRAK